MQFECGSNCAFIKLRNGRSANGIRAWQSPATRPSAEMKLIAPIALVVVATSAGVWGTSALEEPADECSARIADVDRERQRVDLNLRRLQESLATRGVIVPDHYTMLAKYLV